ncbi:MAG: helix-turn-helix transcriptional regulator [Bacilli bacterium]|nr:helix-turn-helix transcriptional regulator [Bacilli bacterium]
MNQEKIGQFIKKIRQDNKLTQKELADKLGVTYQAVSKWENGKNVPDISIMKEISKMFNVDIDEILDGEKKPKKNSNLYGLIIVIILIILLGVGYLLYNNDSDYEFKTITTTCSDFKIAGSAAYNKDKATIYISNVEFCGKEDTTKYKTITCTLYETYNDSKTKISNCDKKKNINLEDFLKELQVNTNHSSKTCKNLSKSSLTLEIKAKDENNKTVTYTIPIKLNDSCK